MGSNDVKNKAGIDPGKLRIRENSWIAKIAAKKLGTETVAMVTGNTIHLHKVNRQEFLNNAKWVEHEACHLRQFQRHGFFLFIIRYLLESVRHGYYNNKYETEARLAEKN